MIHAGYHGGPVCHQSCVALLLLLSPLLVFRNQAGRRRGELGHRSAARVRILHEPLRGCAGPRQDLAGEAAEEVLALRPREMQRVVRAKSVAVPLEVGSSQERVADVGDDPAVARVLPHALLARHFLVGLVRSPSGHVVALELILSVGKTLELGLHALGHD